MPKPSSSDLRRSKLVHSRPLALHLPRAGTCAVIAFHVLSLSPSAGRAQFVNATSGALAGQYANRAAWVDFDGDGDLDLAFLTVNGTQLFRHDPGGFVVMGPPGGCCASSNQTWGDFDDDGDPDLYQVHGMYGDFPEHSRLVRNQGGGSLQDVQVATLQGMGVSAAWVDFDKDGDLDLSVFNWSNGSASNRLYRNDGADVFVNVTSSVFGSSFSRSGAWGDYDNDGDLDLYLVNSTAPNRLLRNDAGVFVDVTSGPLPGSVTYSWHSGAAWGDYDNDGDLDLVLAVDGDQPRCRLYRNDGGGTFVDVTTSPLADANRCVGVAWGDYDNDGHVDLLLAGASKLFRNDGGGSFAQVDDAVINGTGSSAVSWGDVDNDGDLDVFFSSSSTTASLLRNDVSNGNHWLHLDLVGTASNRDAIGARIEVTAAGVTQIRENSDSGGNSKTVEFGLGAATVATAIVVRWPSGLVQLRTGVAADQHLTITEPMGTGSLPPASLTYAFHGNAPNPFNPSTTFAFDLPGSQRVSLVIYDVLGHPVRALVNDIMPAGRSFVSWDGRNDAGRQVASGVYISSLRAGAFQRTHRMTLLK